MTFRNDSDVKKPMSLFTLSSLTDIVLLLLIFFLLTSSFVTNYGIRVNVPRAESSAQVEQQHINVAITPEGDFYVDGEQIAREQLGAHLRQQVQETANASIVIRADKQAVVDDAVHVMNIGQALNVTVLMAAERSFR